MTGKNKPLSPRIAQKEKKNEVRKKKKSEKKIYIYFVYIYILRSITRLPLSPAPSAALEPMHVLLSRRLDRAPSCTNMHAPPMFEKLQQRKRCNSSSSPSSELSRGVNALVALAKPGKISRTKWFQRSMFKCKPTSP